jgi:hypothetical protein
VGKFVADPAVAKANLSEALQTLKDGIAALDSVAGFTAHLVRSSRGNLSRYSVNNQILILCKRPEATEVGGFQHWVKRGRKPLAGRGVRILAPATFTRKVEVQDEDGNLTEEERTMRRFKTVTVWDIADTDGPALPAPAPAIFTATEPGTADPLPFSWGPEADDAAVTLDAELRLGLAQSYATLVKDETVPGAYGAFYPRENVIRITREGHDHVTNASTVAHEGSHAVMHHTPDLRGGGYDTEEQVAEGAAFAYLCRHGLRTDRFSFSYIRGYGGNGKAVAALLTRIGQVTQALVACVEGEQQGEVAA